MARKQSRPPATRYVTLFPLQITCQKCGSRMCMGHHSHRTVTYGWGNLCLNSKET